MRLAVDVREVVYALSDALDLVGVDDFYHGKRVGLMAREVARAAGMSPAQQADLFEAGLLHDCGVSSTAMHAHLVKELDWRGASEHCIRGRDLLSEFAPFARFAECVYYHHTHWADLVRDGVERDLALRSNLIFLVDRVDALTAPYYGPNLLDHVQEVRDTIAGLAGKLFAPELVESFLRASHAEAFWLVLEPRYVLGYLERMLRDSERVLLEREQLRRMATLFSRVVDAKSRFTADHSLGVGALARLLGGWSGLADEACIKLELAGLMHDIGKLQVPDAILEKPGPLSDEERRAMHRHSFETYQILRRISDLEDVATWAAWHHETLDGGGYPYGLDGGALPLEARILAVADVFQALAQARPYRGPMEPAQILAELRRRADLGLLDARVVALVGERLDTCRQAALYPAQWLV